MIESNNGLLYTHTNLMFCEDKMDYHLNKAIEYIDARLDTIDKAPNSWGSCESLELQTLLLLEIREQILTGNLPNIRMKFIAFIRSKIKNSTNEPLFLQLKKQNKESDLPKLLSEFRDLMCKN